MLRPGPLNLISDVPGILVGHAADEGAKSGVTTLLVDGFWPAGADVRGGGPGGRETEVLAPENLVGKAHAVVFSGGSVYGLAAADGVVAALAERGVGLTVLAGTPPIPIVPAAVLYDLGETAAESPIAPYLALGRASVPAAGRRFALGSVGAGRGARAGLVKGGVGSASLDLGDGLLVGALVAVNSAGSVFMEDGRTYWAWPFEIDGEFGGRRPGDIGPAIEPLPEQSALARLGRLQGGANTTLAVVAASAGLTTAECRRLAIMAQDGLARAIRPLHTPFDGDTVFALAKGTALPAEGPVRAVALARLGSAAADCLARAVARAVHCA